MRKRELKSLLLHREAEINQLLQRLRELKEEIETRDHSDFFMEGQLALERSSDFTIHSAGPWNEMG